MARDSGEVVAGELRCSNTLYEHIAKPRSRSNRVSREGGAERCLFPRASPELGTRPIKHQQTPSVEAKNSALGSFCRTPLMSNVFASVWMRSLYLL